MADQTSDAPQGMETKDMSAEFHTDPNAVRPAPVPYSDSTHIDRDEANRPASASDKPSESSEPKTTRKPAARS